MAITDHNASVFVPYGLNDTFEALKRAMRNLQEFKVEQVDDITKSIKAKAGVSLFSWGENISVSVSPANLGTNVSFLSAPKTGAMFGGMADMGKNRKNIDAIMGALSLELKDVPQLSQTNTEVPVNATDASGIATDELRKLKALLDDGIITQEEFNVKKKQLLGI